MQQQITTQIDAEPQKIEKHYTFLHFLCIILRYNGLDYV